MMCSYFSVQVRSEPDRVMDALFCCVNVVYGVCAYWQLSFTSFVVSPKRMLQLSLIFLNCIYCEHCMFNVTFRNGSFLYAAILSSSGGRTVALDALCVAASVCLLVGSARFSLALQHVVFNISAMGKAHCALSLHPPEPRGHWGGPLPPVKAKARCEV